MIIHRDFYVLLKTTLYHLLAFIFDIYFIKII
jgi:hypothetical protein